MSEIHYDPAVSRGWVEAVEPDPEPPVVPTYQCEHCNTEYATRRARTECCQYQCSGCGARHSTTEALRECCYHCSSCGATYEYGEDANDCCAYRCPDCGETFDTQRGANRCCSDGSEETDPFLHSSSIHLIKLDRSSRRRPRVVSIEQEISHGMDRVSELFDSRGWHGRGTEVKDDGSLSDDGVEIVYSKLDLYDEGTALAFSEKIQAVRKLRNDREIRTGSLAGTHIHVSAHDMDGRRVTPKALASVYGAFCHCEGAIYRIAAAGWARHRREEASTDYAAILRKKQDLKLKDVFTLQNPSERYYGVNYSRIMTPINYCSCGAVKVGDWQDCTCDYWDQATWEWRVFNSSTRPQTIHAWILLAVGLTDWAIKHDCTRLPIHGYDVNGSRGSLQTQVDFILGFNYSDAEREVLKGVIAMSPGLRDTV